MAFSVAACGSGIKETKEVLPDMSSNLKDKVGDVVEKTEPQIEEKVMQKSKKL